MSRTIKILLCLTFILIIVSSFSFVFAEEEVAEEASEETTEEVQETTLSNENPLSVFKPSTGTTVSNMSDYGQANLQLNNILCIILIAIGVILILFAIAILIRIG